MRDGIGGGLLEHLGHVVHADIHVLQGAQCHFLHLERLDRGLEGGGVLLQPELHGTQFLDAAIDFFRIHGGGNPLRRRRRQRTRLRHLAQEIESGYELAEIKTGGVHGHGGSPVWLARIRQAYRKPLQPNRQAFPQTGSRAAGQAAQWCIICWLPAEYDTGRTGICSVRSSALPWASRSSSVTGMTLPACTGACRSISMMW